MDYNLLYFRLSEYHLPSPTTSGVLLTETGNPGAKANCFVTGAYTSLRFSFAKIGGNE
jgi:hypothetical protein